MNISPVSVCGLFKPWSFKVVFALCSFTGSLFATDNLPVEGMIQTAPQVATTMNAPEPSTVVLIGVAGMLLTYILRPRLR